MLDPVQDLFNKSFAAHKASKLDEALRGYDALLNRQPYDGMLLYLVGNVMLQQGHHGQAITMLEAAVRADESNAGAWNDLGCALKAEHFEDGASIAWEKSIELGGRTAATLNNLATLYADSGYPEKALPYIEEALAQDPENPHVRWNMALALLTKGNWAEGWEAHEYRYQVNNKNVGQRGYGPLWQGEKDGLLVIHGEQGLGDEIMFATCLPELLAEHPYAVIECEKKLVSLFARSFDVPCIAKEEDFVAPPGATVRQIGMGSMPRRYRNSDAEFPPPRAVLKADPQLVKEARALVADLPRPLIGYSWMGGTKVTRVQHRSLSAAAVKSMHPGKGTAISLQYGQYADVEGDAAGLLRFGAWTDGSDLDKLAAFLTVLDEIVTVCTTLVHLSGALGLKAHVLTPLRSSWRYGQKNGPGAMLWYPQHTLHRQPTEGDWKPVIKEVTDLFKGKYA